MTANKKFYITFGDQYRREPHPAGDWVHPDGYLTIIADDPDIARDKAFDITEGRFAFMYDKIPDPTLFPLGETMRITA